MAKVLMPVNHQTPQSIAGKDPSGNVVPINVDNLGNIITSGSGGGGGGGGSSTVSGSTYNLGDTGTSFLAVRKDIGAALVSEGEYQPTEVDEFGNLRTVEGMMSAAENNTDGVIMTEEQPLATSNNALDYDSSAALEASSVAKASAGRLYEVDFLNTNGATRYLQFFNSPTVPADTAFPFLSFPVAAGASFNRSWPKGLYFSTGISWANSSTAATKTIGSADSLAQVGYK